MHQKAIFMLISSETNYGMLYSLKVIFISYWLLLGTDLMTKTMILFRKEKQWKIILVERILCLMLVSFIYYAWNGRIMFFEIFYISLFMYYLKHQNINKCICISSTINYLKIKSLAYLWTHLQDRINICNYYHTTISP